MATAMTQQSAATSQQAATAAQQAAARAQREAIRDQREEAAAAARELIDFNQYNPSSSMESMIQIRQIFGWRILRQSLRCSIALTRRWSMQPFCSEQRRNHGGEVRGR
ncbi:unnamed protein product [Trifolium pratense]|uniref:Uncharacterized protein n=1 Tax=Trifolium pratense TaxID=57577 RepID=A0ACB0LCH5_TRIPR|nr:unnamed protein product [Trifolium pratense]